MTQQSPPDDVLQCLAVAVSYHQSGRLDEAESLYRQILASQPRHPDALHLLGVIAYQTDRYDEAVDLISQAIDINPHVAGYHSNLGIAFRKWGKLDQAIICYHQALKLQPDFVEVYGNLGMTLHLQFKLDEAAAAYRDGLAIKRDSPDLLNGLAVVLQEQRHFAEALLLCRQALLLRPGFAEAFYNLGVILPELDQLHEAAIYLGRALDLTPNDPNTLNNLGAVLRELGRLDDAMACFERTIALRAHSPEAHLNRALIFLSLGEFRRAWPDYSWRWLRKDRGKSLQRTLKQPLWRGEPAEGRTILLWEEQGFGDSLQFIRYAPAVRHAGWTVIVEARPLMARLFSAIEGISVVVGGHPLPHFDVHCPLLDLPAIFDTTPKTIPADIPYLVPPADLVVKWRQKLAATQGLKLGVCWRGNWLHIRGRRRSLAPQNFADFLDLPGLAVKSLQQDARADEIAALGIADTPVEICGPFEDFADSAALICQLDLVISVDTSVAHLAGALGVPVWILLDYSPDWRWLRDRADTPWYPTMRLFRQPSPGDWPSVMRAVRRDLQRLSQKPPTLWSRFSGLWNSKRLRGC